MQAGTLSQSTNPAASRRGGRRLPTISSSGTTKINPIGRWTATGWNRPRNCSQSPCVFASNRNISGIDNRARQPRSDAQPIACSPRPFGTISRNSKVNPSPQPDTRAIQKNARRRCPGQLPLRSLDRLLHLIMSKDEPLQQHCIEVPSTCCRLMLHVVYSKELAWLSGVSSGIRLEHHQRQRLGEGRLLRISPR